MWSTYLAKNPLLTNKSTSLSSIVFIKYSLFEVEKNNDPDFPAPHPNSSIEVEFAKGENALNKSFLSTLKLFLSLSIKSGAYSVTGTSLKYL